MKSIKLKKPMILISVLILTALLLSTVSAQSLYQVDIARTVDSTEVILGQQQDIKFTLSGPSVEVESDISEEPKEIALVIDVSGSMDWDIYGNKTGDSNKKRLTMAKIAAKDFVDNIYNNTKNTKICIVPYTTTANSASSLQSVITDREDLKLKIDKLSPTSSTNIGDGLRRAYWILNKSSNTQAKKYILLLTDGEPNAWTVKSSKTSSYYYDDGNAPATKSGSEGCYDATEYPKAIGTEYIQKNNYKTFAIGFTTGTSKTRLEEIAVACGSEVVEGDKHYYYADSGDALKKIYEVIGTQIVEEMSFKSANFSFLLPEGVEAVEGSLPKDFIVDKSGARQKITGTFSNLVLKRDSSGKYQMVPVNFNVRVKYTSKGQKVFTSDDCILVYSDPFENNNTVKPSPLTVNVTQPVTGINITGREMVRVGESETYSAAVLPEDADSDEVTWSFNGSSSTADFDTGTGILKAKERGNVSITATSVGLSVNKEKISIDKNIQIIDPKFNLNVYGSNEMLVNSSQTIDTTVNPIDVQDSPIAYSWSSSDDTIAVVDDTGKVTAISNGKAAISCTASGKDLIGDSFTETKEIVIEVTKPQPYQISVNSSVEGTTVIIGSEQEIRYSLTGPEALFPSLSVEKPVEIALVIDESYSMRWDMNGNGEGAENGAIRKSIPDAEKRISIAKDAALKFVQKFKDEGKNTKISLIGYDNSANVYTSLLSVNNEAEFDTLCTKISELASRSNTNTGDALRRANFVLKAGAANAQKYVVLLSDGYANRWTGIGSADSTQKNTYKLDNGNASYTQWDNNSQNSVPNGMDYSIKAGDLIKKSGFTTFAIGFSAREYEISKLEQIAVACGAADIGTGSHYYNADSALALNRVYDAIGDQILSSLPIKDANFSMLLPAGVDASEYPEGFIKSSDAETGRIKLSGSINGLELRLGDEGKYQLVPKEFSIKVKYETKGKKVFLSNDSKLEYVDPFSNKCTAYSNEFSVNIIQPLSGISIDGKDMVKVGKSETYKAVIDPVDADNTSVIWSYDSNTEFAEFDTQKGILKGKARGDVTINVTTVGLDKDGEQLSASKDVQVIDPKLNLSLTGNANMNVTDSQTIVPSVSPIDMKAETITYSWTSSNPTLAEVNTAGEVTAKAKGSVTITCTATGKDLIDESVTESKTITITIAQPVTGVTINGNTMMRKGTVENYSATVSPAGSGDATLSKIGSDSIATFDASTGDLTGVARGTVTIKAVSDGVNASGLHEEDTMNVQVIDPKINPSVAGNSSMNVWKSADFTASISIIDMQPGTITYDWSSMNTSVATVTADAADPSKAVVTTKTDGSTTIICKVKGKDLMGIDVEETASFTVNVGGKVDIN